MLQDYKSKVQELVPNAFGISDKPELFTIKEHIRKDGGTYLLLNNAFIPTGVTILLTGTLITSDTISPHE